MLLTNGCIYVPLLTMVGGEVVHRLASSSDTGLLEET